MESYYKIIPTIVYYTIDTLSGYFAYQKINLNLQNFNFTLENKHSINIQ